MLHEGRATAPRQWPMMVDERKQLPESVGGLVDVAVRAYRRRFPLYFGVALAGLIAEAVIAYARPGDQGFSFAGSIVVDALIGALVTIGIVSDMRQDERQSNAAILMAAFARWGIVSLVAMLVGFVTSFSSNAVFGAPEDTQYWLLLVPIVIVWGSLGFATVIAAVDEKTPPTLLIWSSIGRSISLALARENIGRLIPLALVAVLPALVEAVLTDQLALRKIAGASFIGNMPIDAFVSGPLQAVFTMFYLDFVRRTSGARRS